MARPPAPSKRCPRSVEAALRKITLLQSAHKYASVGTLPMDALVHGLIKDDEDWPFPEYAWRMSFAARPSALAWLDSRAWAARTVRASTRRSCDHIL